MTTNNSTQIRVSERSFTSHSTHYWSVSLGTSLSRQSLALVLTTWKW